MSFGVVEGESRVGPDGLTVAQIDAHPFGEIRFTGQRWALADVRLLSPILPSKIVCVGRNYAEHAAELGNQVPAEPMIFLKPSTAVIGPHDTVRLPPQSSQVEHEAELAVVIGPPGARRVDRAGAARAIFGYTCGNDVTARDLQRRDGQWTRAKGFDGFCPLGPWIETEVDPSDLAVECRVNGEIRQAARTSQMAFGPNVLVEFGSRVMTLLPGDVILTGPPAGIGPVQIGDLVEVEVEGIGVLENEVVEGA